jgi:hypothetical protein
VSPVSIPTLAVLVVVALTFVLANVLAAGPGWAASRAHPADALRTE